jgi:hypothetical protein
MKEFNKKVPDLEYGPSSAKKSATDRKNLRSTSAMKKRTIEQEDINKTKKLPYDNMKSLMDEIEHLKNFCRDLKQTMEENCVMGNERKNFEKMKSENIKLTADFNILKEDMQEMMTNYHNIAKRVTQLEEENKSLRIHNKNLVKFVSKNKGVGNNEEIFQYDYEEQPNYYDKRMNRTNIDNSYHNDMSHFNNMNMTVNNTSSAEMNHIIQGNQDRFQKGRFLIPKGHY